jgi:hypothetical protein
MKALVTTDLDVVTCSMTPILDHDFAARLTISNLQKRIPDKFSDAIFACTWKPCL